MAGPFQCAPSSIGWMGFRLYGVVWFGSGVDGLIRCGEGVSGEFEEVW